MASNFVNQIINETPSEKNVTDSSSIMSTSFVDDIVTQIKTPEDKLVIESKEPKNLQKLKQMKL